MNKMAFWDGYEYLIMALTVIVIVVGSVAVWWFEKPKDASGYVESSRPSCVNCDK